MPTKAKVGLPNPDRPPRLEKADEKWLYGEVRGRGGLCIKMLSATGLPDRLVLLPGGRLAFIELKTPVGKLSKIQKWWLAKLTSLGFMAVCLSDRGAIRELLNHLQRGAKHET